MNAFTSATGTAVPLMMENCDTDVIIRVDRLTSRTLEGLRAAAFEAIRMNPDGTPNMDCTLNQPQFRGAPILLTGANFGCGSSREPAVWAIQALGVRAIVAESYGDIFYGNCFHNGLLPVVLPRAEVDALAAEAATGATGFTVDLEALLVSAPSGRTCKFEIDAHRRQSLLEGLDEIGQTLKSSATITAWQQRDRSARPWVWLSPAVQLERS